MLFITKSVSGLAYANGFRLAYWILFTYLEWCKKSKHNPHFSVKSSCSIFTWSSIWIYKQSLSFKSSYNFSQLRIYRNVMFLCIIVSFILYCVIVSVSLKMTTFIYPDYHHHRIPLKWNFLFVNFLYLPTSSRDTLRHT